MLISNGSVFNGKHAICNFCQSLVGVIVDKLLPIIYAEIIYLWGRRFPLNEGSNIIVFLACCFNCQSTACTANSDEIIREMRRRNDCFDRSCRNNYWLGTFKSYILNVSHFNLIIMCILEECLDSQFTCCKKLMAKMVCAW